VSVGPSGTIPEAFHVARTAFFLNFTGCCIQEQTGAADVPLKRVMRIIANVLLDWFWLAKEQDLYTFKPAGELIWAPGLDGGNAYILPAATYPTALLHGRFVQPRDFFESRVVQAFQPQKLEDRSGDLRVTFAPFISEKALVAHNIIAHEERFWRILVRRYNKLDELQLFGLASCRTPLCTLYSFAAQLGAWWRYIRAFLHSLLRISLQCPPYEIDYASLDLATACVLRLTAIMEQHNGIDELRDAIMLDARRDELGEKIPCSTDQPKYAALAALQLKRVRDSHEGILALHDLTSQIKPAVEQRTYNQAAVDLAVNATGGIAVREPAWRSPAWWHSRYLNDIRAITVASQEMVDNLVEVLESELGLPIRDEDKFYQYVLQHHPLPAFRPAYRGSPAS